MTLRLLSLVSLLSLASLSLFFVACRSDPRTSEQQLWSLGGTTYGNPPQDGGMPMADARLPSHDAGSHHDASAPPHDAGSHHDAGWPFDAGPPHDAGTIPYDGGTGVNTFWKDTDGIEPELAGCHIEYTAAGCATAGTRQFGESCSANGLIETNPGPGVCHDHPLDVGHPYVVDCDGWCRGVVAITTETQSFFRGVAARSGRCQVIGYLPCNGGFVDSARCLCSDGYKGNGETTPPEGYPGD